MRKDPVDRGLTTLSRRAVVRHDRVRDAWTSARSEAPPPGEVETMEWDLGIQGVGVLVAMSLGFALIAQLVAGRVTTHRVWGIARGAELFGREFSDGGGWGGGTGGGRQPNNTCSVVD